MRERVIRDRNRKCVSEVKQVLDEEQKDPVDQLSART